MSALPESHILRPQPRRTGASFSLATDTSPTERSPEPASELSTPDTSPTVLDRRGTTISGEDHLSNGINQGRNIPATPQKTRSILNLTSSTLFGIYSPVGYDSSRDGSTPWGNGAQTPARSRSGERNLPRNQVEPFSQISAHSMANNTVAIDGQQSRRSHSRRKIMRTVAHRSKAFASPMNVLLRVVVLFLLGMAYGEVIAHLHDTRSIAPVSVVAIDRGSWAYLIFWGMASVMLGLGLPWLDNLQIGEKARDAEETSRDSKIGERGELEAAAEDEGKQNGSLGMSWNPVVRSVGAFVGIAFAIVRVPGLLLFSEDTDCVLTA